MSLLPSLRCSSIQININGGSDWQSHTSDIELDYMGYSTAMAPSQSGAALRARQQHGYQDFTSHNICVQMASKKGIFHCDGDIIIFLERITVAGFLMVIVHRLRGKRNHARRAAARCANSTIVSAGNVLGYIIGNVIGAVFGAIISTPIAIIVENLIGSGIDDPCLIEDYLTQASWNGLSAAAVSCLGGLVSPLISWIAGIAIDFGGYWGFKKIVGCSWNQILMWGRPQALSYATGYQDNQILRYCS